jgi:hypothetical protein
MNNEPDKTLDLQFEADLQAVAIHESGHFEACLALGVPATMKIEIDDAGNIREGLCWQGFELPKYETSVFSWAGVVAEHLSGCIYRFSPQILFPLDAERLFRWHGEASFFLDPRLRLKPERGAFSEEDRAGIVGVLPGGTTLESCQAAYRILSKRISELKDDARLLADKTRIERNQKMAAAREAKELAKRLEGELRPVIVDGQTKVPVSITGRARILAEFIQGLHPNDPRRIRLAPALESFKRGIVPELNGELRLTKEEMEALKT